MSGSVKVRNVKKSQAIIKSLIEEYDDDELQVTSESKDGITTLEVSGGILCSYSTVREIENKLLELSPYAVGEAGRFDMKTGEDDKDILWIGTEEQIHKATRKKLITELTELYNQLTPEEQKEFLEDKFKI